VNASAKFMAPLPQKPEALAWLKDAPRDASAPWVRALRETGAEIFASTGFPTPAWEGWQHTNLRALAQAPRAWSSAPVKFDAGKIPASLIEGSSRIVLVNGQYQPQLSTLPPGVTLTNLMEAEGVEEWIASVGNFAAQPLKALNAAHLRDGFVLDVKGDIAQPIEILFHNTGGAIYPRLLCRLEKNAGATIIEHHAGEGDYFADSVADYIVERDARLKLYRLQRESLSAHHVSQGLIHLHKNASFEGFSMALGAKVAREEFSLNLLDSVISASISGMYLLKSQQNHDFTITADHFEPDGKSEQYFKGVIDDQARAVFQGKIHVRRSAQKSDGYQSHHALLLSNQAEASAKPELEIYADDVKCSHGATSGHLDPVALFYLRSRGIPEEEAKALLVESFLNEAVERVSFAPMREVYLKETSCWLKEKSI
jgi:Fe-S cluster assembly protein SufD